MKTLLRLRQSWTVVAVAALAGCNAPQNFSPNAGAGSHADLGSTRMMFNHGGRFTAAYSGTYSKSGDCSATAMFTYKGSGDARFLHSSREQVKFTWYCGSRNVTGSATLASIHAPGNSITASVSSTDFQS